MNTKIKNSIYNIPFAITFIIILFLILNPVNTFAENNNTNTTNDKTIKVGYVNVPTYEEGKDGEYKTGAGYEYLQKISYFTGWKYEYVYGSFKELYQMLINGEIDLFDNISYTEERTSLFNYSKYPQGKETYYLYTTTNRSDLLYSNIKEFSNLKIGVTKDSNQKTVLIQWLENNNITADIIEFDGYNTSMKALDNAEIDAIATPQLSNNYNYATIIDYGFCDYYFAVAKDKTDILSELNEALYEIQSSDPNYNAVLQSKYQVNMLSDTFINAKERAWLDTHNNTIRMGYLDNNLPYSDLDDNGNFIGVLNALTETMQDNFNINIKVYCYNNHTELYSAFLNGEIDAIGPSYSDYWLAEQYDLIQTNSIITSTPVLFFNSNSNENVTGTIATSNESFISSDVIKILFPDSEILFYDTTKDCFNSVINGQANSTIVTASQINLMKQFDINSQLQIAEVSKQIDICICTTKSEPELANIINKGITAAGTFLSGAVLSQNSYIEHEYTFKDFFETHIMYIILIIAIVITILLFILIYMYNTSKRLQAANIEITQKQAELENALQTAEYANNAKTTFLANMSHDIRTPINGIMGMLNIIEKSENNKQKTDECLDKIKTSSEHLLQLINDVLDLSRLESGQVILEHVPFNLRQVGEEALSVVESQAIENNIQTISEHIDGTNIWLIGSPLHFKQILINLYTNSIKYNKPNGTLYTNIEEYSRTNDTLTLKITVKDTGIGMTKEFVDNELFTPFIQGENGPRTKFKGTGLGLSIVKEIVEEMNGYINVESEVDKGSTFTVILPFQIDHSNHIIENKQTEKAIDISGTKILLVEDNELNIEIAEFILQDAGAVITKASNGQIAVDTFTNSPVGTFDIILMDIMMPVMNGIDATKNIRQLNRPDATTIPIFAMTANAFSEDIKKSIEAGMNEQLSKPLDPNKMIELISKYTKNKL